MDRKKIREICESLTNREKAILVTMQWLSPDQENYLEPYGIEKLRLSDSPKCPDYMMEDDETWEKTTDHTVCFPSPAAQASSWSKEMLAELGRRMGAAAKERGLHGLYRPAVNIKRYTLNGRNGEYFSEDPVLAGELAASFIQAVQSRGVAATVKHYAVNSQEFERMCMNAVVSERALREIYLRVFQIAIEKGNPWMLMTSYNKVNGSYVNENGLLMDILRKEWNYDGFVVSDGGAVQNGTAVSAHRNGMDFELGAHIADVQNALDRGELSAEAVDNNIRRIIELCEKAAGTDCAEKENRMDDHRFARKFAADTLILLKNDNAVLPLKKTDNIAVIGTFAKYCHFACGGSAFSNPYIKENSYDEIVKLAGRKMPFAEAYRISHDPDHEFDPDPGKIREAVEIAGKADLVLYFTGLPYPYESEAWDRRTFDLPVGQTKAFEEIIKVNPNVVLINTSACSVNLLPYMGAAAILQNCVAGEAAGGAVADVLYGKSEPGGRLSETFPVRIEDTPAYLYTPNYPVSNPDVWYGEDIFVGYRYYEKRKLDPLFPFGYGLSYTDFEYSEPVADYESISADGRVTVSIKVKNTGNRAGSQVIQFYVSPQQCHAIRPVKELKGFAKVYLQPGETKKAETVLDRQAFEYFSEAQHKWIVENAVYDILIGTSSRDIIGKVSVKVNSSERSIRYHDKTPLEWVFRNPHMEEARAALTSLNEAQQARLDMYLTHRTFGTSPYANGAPMERLGDEMAPGPIPENIRGMRQGFSPEQLGEFAEILNSFKENE